MNLLEIVVTRAGKRGIISDTPRTWMLAWRHIAVETAVQSCGRCPRLAFLGDWPARGLVAAMWSGA
jgi:hypothetical protein